MDTHSSIYIYIKKAYNDSMRVCESGDVLHRKHVRLAYCEDQWTLLNVITNNIISCVQSNQAHRLGRNHSRTPEAALCEPELFTYMWHRCHSQSSLRCSGRKSAVPMFHVLLENLSRRRLCTCQSETESGGGGEREQLSHSGCNMVECFQKVALS